MVYEHLRLAINTAKEAASHEAEYGREVFTAVLTSELVLAGGSAPKARPILTKSLSLGELLNSKSPKNDVQKTLVFGYYLEAVKKMKEFSSKDIYACYREAKERVPPNISDKIKMNVQRAWMSTTGKDGISLTYSLTSTGVSAVEQGFVSED